MIVSINNDALKTIILSFTDVSLSSLTSYARKLDTVAGQANHRVDNKHVEFTESDRPKSASSPKKKRKKKNPIIVNLSGTRYEVSK